MEYRREIDGLRAVAVLPVIFFHADFSLFSGGFVGVDVFFVISGYLITFILLKEKAEGTFSLAGFYERRARRILPALFVVMAVCIPLAWLWMLPHQLKDFSQSVVAASVFLSNVFFFLESDYFNNFSQTAPLLHTWSLAVEEQYYLLFPLLLMLIWKLGRKWGPVALVLLCVPSLMAAEWGAKNQPAAAFYLLPMRGWELLAGALLAFHAFNRRQDGRLPRPQGSVVLAQVMSLTGLLLILYAMVTLDKNTPFPGLYTLIPITGAMLIILFATADTHVGRLLGSPALVGIGLISYSAYLWHQPLFAFGRILNNDDVSPLMYLVMTALVLPLAWLSWRLVERPARTRRLNRAALVGGTTVVAAAFLTFGYLGHRSEGFLEYKLSQLDPQYRDYAIRKNLELDRRLDLWAKASRKAALPFPVDDRRKRILILGDSKSEDLYMAIRLNEALFEGSTFRRMRLDDECMGIFLGRSHEGSDSRGTAVCRGEVRKLMNSGLLDKADEVVLTANWQADTHRHGAEMVAALTAAGKQVSVVSTANFRDVAALSMNIARERLSRDATGRYLFNNIDQTWHRHSLALQAQLARLGKGRFLEKLDILCDLKRGRCNLFGERKRPWIYDNGHLTVYGARLFGRRIHDREWFP